MQLRIWILPARIGRYIIAALFVLPLNLTPLFAQNNGDCFTCHEDNTLSMQRKGKTVPLFVDAAAYKASVHGSEACQSCHLDFKADETPHAKKIKPATCTECHSDDKFLTFQGSIHGEKHGNTPPLLCQNCHTKHAIQRISDKNAGERKLVAEKICAGCHDSVNKQYMASDHGTAFKNGKAEAPTCIDCHGEHNVLSTKNLDAKTSRSHEDKICLSCHERKEGVGSQAGSSTAFVALYEKSVHHQAILRGNSTAAICSDCHGSHSMKKGADPASSVSRHAIASTCGKCHDKIQAQFDKSVHGKSLAAGVNAAATCTDCHGEHNILSSKDPRSPVTARNVSAQVCSPCHSSLKLSQKYGLRSDRFKTFATSYHGLAGKSGSVEVANCASCHGVHDIRPSSDPASLIHKDNLAKTCGTCHPGANANFTRGSIHLITEKERHDVLYYVATIYILMIILTIGGMIIHNALDFFTKSKLQLKYRRGILERKHHEAKTYLRMTLNERIQHAILVASFVALVITGFALRFPDAWWVRPIFAWFPSLFDVRSLLHRIAGAAMVAVSLYHLWYIFFVPRGRELVRDLFPAWKDVTDLFGMMAHYIGLAKKKPMFGRFSYIEKAEYWALIWGTVIMGITGVILWFDNTFMGILTKLGWDIARTIHYYEAWLATLAIFVWHFYFVIFNPTSYPLNLAFWKGSLTAEEMADDHPLELEKLKQKDGP